MDIYILCMILALLVVASLTDLRSNRIPNILTCLAMVAGLTYHYIFNGIDGLIFSAQGLGVGIALLIFPFLAGGMGAGDAKLMGAIGSLLGPKDVFHSFLFSAIAGGFYALAVIFLNKNNLKSTIYDAIETLKSLILTRRLIFEPGMLNKNMPRLCYALPISLGTAVNIVLNKILGYNLFG